MEATIIFEKLKKALAQNEVGLEVKKDQADYYYLNTNKLVKNKEVFFGAVQIRKAYVAFHLYPVYTNPELLEPISDSLKKRMQGKSCFNFKKEITDTHLTELIDLTKRSYDKYREIGFIEA